MIRSRWLFSITALLGMLTLQAAWSQNASERQVLERAAKSLGGLERINGVKNITLVGYGQYVYQFGGGNIGPEVNAPMKYQAANDMRRVYDLGNNRFLQQERRNFLFPFAAVFGHSYQQVNLFLDGDVAFDINREGKKQRIPGWSEGVLQHDGVHMRRMWMMNNPVVAVRAALAKGAKLSNVRSEDKSKVVDIQIAEGDRMSMAFSDQSGLPTWIRWNNPHDNLGEITYTTYFSGFVPYGGLMLPLGYVTKTDWRNIDYLKVYVDDYIIDGEIPDLVAPPEVRSADVPASRVLRPLEVESIAKGIWRINTGTIVFEFKDHLTLFELGGSRHQAKAVIEKARSLVPGKPVTEVIVSHAHFDHVAGIRQAIAEGLTVISRRNNEIIFQDMASHRAKEFPDDQDRNQRPLKFVPVDERLRLSDNTMSVDIYWARANIHMAEAIFAYVPAAKVMVEGDIATAAVDYQFWADNYMDNIEYYKLDVETLAPVHMQTMKQAEVLEMVKGGVQRARERCAAELAKGNYFPGCPVVSKRF
ncbi:glyoxylase-like metal-dependent hydrolase (beta-lactamase superfamily II) [Povalibacter uvarum]|uniref:Glyoxylase-like metal-dependent hydrolase (Beta-lactamase superfamily II) n=1 Tax=Povalibacter uvarum TaxID=732238 RepID=A0A841HW80_9GAMM|nr:MBL fold metallo-hydrolase [Povalibacter uvarum]MBB6096460.1 glyoxylase-like metal-dependent hydrolase (beta-lactamase superfamily II) [Povalibacter uvarum]